VRAYGGALVGIAICAAIAAGMARRGDAAKMKEGEAPRAVIAPQRESRAPSTPRAEEIAPATAREEAASLRGTEVDGALEVDSRGAFVPSEAAIRMFDYFLATAGERTDAEIRARVAAEAERRLGPGEAPRVLERFDRYVASRSALASRLRRLTAGDLQGALAETRAARAEAFGAGEARLLFATDDALAERLAAEIAIRRDPSLDEAERARRIDALEEALPDAVRARRAARNAVMRDVARQLARTDIPP
jgi:lipase chaperone LimK